MTVQTDRGLVLAAVVISLAILVWFVLSEVIVTVFFAVTVAYVLTPLFARLVDAGIPRWWASVVTTVMAFVAAGVLLSPLAVILYARRRQLIQTVELLPDSLVLEISEFTYIVNTGEVVTMATRWVSATAIAGARAAPVLAIKAFLFAIVVFALLLRGRHLRQAVLAPIPPRYHDVAAALHGRTRDTLFALYIVQAMTAAGTFLIAIPVFVGFGFSSPIVLAVIAGILQFLPIVGPSVLIAALAVYEVSLGAPTKALLLLAVGIIVIGMLPDAFIRPRLARHTGELPGSLYFVGFTGGLLTVGPVGIIAGPLLVALLLEVLSLLAHEVNTPRSRFQG